MANFFELLGFSSDELADSMPEKIVQAFHDNGKDGVRVLMYEEMARRLSAPLHIYNCNSDGSTSSDADVYGKDQPGEPIKLTRETTDLYRKYGEPSAAQERSSPDGAPVAARKRSTGGGTGSKATGPDAWEKRFQDLADFVNKNGFRPRRTAELDTERHLHYWMGQQQRKLGKGELPREQAEKLSAVLEATKGKKADTVRKTAVGGGGSSSRRSAAAAVQAAADDDAGGDEGEGGDDAAVAGEQQDAFEDE